LALLFIGVLGLLASAAWLIFLLAIEAKIKSRKDLSDEQRVVSPADSSDRLASTQGSSQPPAPQSIFVHMARPWDPTANHL
jgi:hypothetical protein